MPNTFPTTVPNPSSIKTSTIFRTLTNNFGDGYEQFAPDGINTKSQTFEISWDVLNLSDMATISNFLDTEKGVSAFNWTNPNTEVSETVRLVPDSFHNTRDQDIYVGVSVKFKTAYGY